MVTLGLRLRHRTVRKQYRHSPREVDMLVCQQWLVANPSWFWTAWFLLSMQSKSKEDQWCGSKSEELGGRGMVTVCKFF